MPPQPPTDDEEPPAGTRRPARTPGRAARSGQRPRSAATATNVQVAYRRRDVLTLRHGGYSYSQIADTIREKYALARYDRADAAHDTRIALDQVVEEPAREVLAVELSTLNAMQASVWAAAIDPKNDRQIPAILTVLKVMERRARYLGLDSPVKHDLTGGDRDTVTINLADPAAVALAGLAMLNEIATEADRRAFAAIDRELPAGAPLPPAGHPPPPE